MTACPARDESGPITKTSWGALSVHPTLVHPGVQRAEPLGSPLWGGLFQGEITQVVVVLGLAKSGVSVAKLFHKLGAIVTVNDHERTSIMPRSGRVGRFGCFCYMRRSSGESDYAGYGARGQKPGHPVQRRRRSARRSSWASRSSPKSRSRTCCRLRRSSALPAPTARRPRRR